MVELENHMTELLARKGWDVKKFVALSMLSGLGSDTAYRLARGDTNFAVGTLASFAEVLGCQSIGEIIDIKQPSKEQ